MSEKRNFYALFTSLVYTACNMYESDMQDEIRIMLSKMDKLAYKYESQTRGIIDVVNDIESIISRLSRLRNYGKAIIEFTALIAEPDFHEPFRKPDEEAPN